MHANRTAGLMVAVARPVLPRCAIASNLRGFAEYGRNQ